MSLLDTQKQPLLEQRKKQRLIHLYKATNNLSQAIIPDYVKPSSGCTRTHDFAFIQLQTTYEQYKHSFLPRTFREWNVLPLDLVQAASVDEFSAQLQTHTA